MWAAKRYVSMSVLAATVLLTASACASQSYYHRPVAARTVDRLAYDRGYAEGREQGITDASRRRTFDYQRHKEFRKGDAGYRGYGDRNEYRALFREGFVAGYNEGYRRYASGPYGYPQPNGYPQRPTPSRAPIYRGSAPVYQSAAIENGYRDGYDAGRGDAGDRRRYDPVRVSRYREGDHGYESRYGSRDDYKRDYRAAFMQGYEAGYRSR
jgi:hypothetical protein